MAITLTSNEAANNINANTEQNPEGCAIDINLYDREEIPYSHSDQVNDGDWRNGADLLFEENTGIFEQLLAANNGNETILRGKIAEYAGFTLDGQSCVWSWGDIDIDRLTYFIVFKISFPNATEGSPEFSFTDRLNACNHVRWYFWNRQGVTVRNVNNTARRIRRLHPNGEQEVEPENNTRPGSHTDPIERKNRETQEDYDFFGTGYPSFLADDLFGPIPGTSPVEYRKLDIAYYGLAIIENKFYSDWLQKRKSIPHFPGDFSGIRPRGSGVEDVIIQFDNRPPTYTYFADLNGDRIHFYRTPRIVSVNSSNNTFTAEYFYRYPIRVGVFDESQTPPAFIEDDEVQLRGSINFGNDGKLIRGNNKYRVIYIVDEDDKLQEELSNIFNVFDGRYFWRNPPERDGRWILFLFPGHSNYISNMPSHLQGTFTTIPNGVNVSELVGHYIQIIHDTPRQYGIRFPTDLNSEFEIAGFDSDANFNSGLTFGVGVDIGQPKDDQWLNAYLEQNSDVWNNLTENERKITLNIEDPDPPDIPGMHGRKREPAVRFYFRNRKYFDDLNMQNNIGNWVQNIRSVSEPIGGHLEGRSFIDYVFTGDLDSGFDYAPPIYRVLPRMRRYNGLVASPNSVELLAILPLIYQGGTGIFRSNEIRRRFTHAINTHDLRALRDAVNNFIGVFGENQTRNKVRDFLTHGAIDIARARFMFDITRLKHYYEDIHLNNEL